MKTIQSKTHVIKIYIAGDKTHARKVLQEYVMEGSFRGKSLN